MQLVDVEEQIEEMIDEGHPITVVVAPEFPPGYDKQNPPPSGFVDEPEVYEEVVIGETTAMKRARERLQPLIDEKLGGRNEN
jgi:hypothetical protein